MSGTAPRPAAPTASSLPDPAGFLATSSAVPAATWSAARFAEAADVGVVVAGRERLLVGTGMATTLPLPCGLEDREALLAVRTWLAAVDRAHPDGSMAPPGPMALGAFSFDRGAPAVLLVPSVTWCREAAGDIWRIEVRRRDELGADEAGTTQAARSPVAVGPYDFQQVPPPADYADAVARAVAFIRAGTLRKVVLACTLEVLPPSPAVPSRLLDALWGGDDVFMPFSVPTPSGRLVGASPELVISRRGRTVTSHAFAGTVSLSSAGSDADVERLFDSDKDRSEHRLAVEEIVDALERRCVALTVPAEPTVVRLRSDARLGTLIRGTLTTTPSDGDTALALLALLHPTPAVGGVPRAAALGRIAELEAAPRGYWAGAVGWTDGEGDGEWVLGIRSVELEGRRAVVRAGAGIVEGSDPQAELAETTVKLRPVLEALWPGASSRL